MSEDNPDIDPYTEQAAKRLEDGFDPACKALSVEVAEVRESLSEDYPAVREVLKQAEHCLNRAGGLYVDGGAYEDGHGHE